MKAILIYSLILILTIGSLPAQLAYKMNSTSPKNAILSGIIKDKNTGETLVGANIYLKELKTGAATNIDGAYSISVPSGNYTVVISFTGYEPYEENMEITGNVVLNYDLTAKSVTMKEVVITGVKKNANVENNEMSVFLIKTDQIKSIPALLGEVDVIKAIQLMPGVQSSGEGFSGYNVRGGGADQNLILLDDAPVYNAAHLMGFFSVFNNDALSDAKLYKGDIPASYGGRLSSLLDIKVKEGNSKKFSANAGIGSVSSRLTLEGPVIKDKLSYLISGRRSYADLFLALSPDSNINKNKLYFYDLNLKLFHNISSKDRISFSAYKGRDVYGYDKAVSMNWGNTTQSLKWNHVFSNKMMLNSALFHTNYNYNLILDPAIFGFKWGTGIHDYGFKTDCSYYLDDNNTIRFGISSVYHLFNPGNLMGNNNPAITEMQIPENRALENAFFISNEQKINGLLSVDYGVRFSSFYNIGEGTLYHYNDEYKSTDSVVYKKGEIFNSNAGFEPRLSVKYSLNEWSSIKASYARTRQYVHLASNTQGGTPLDLWFPTTPNVKPQISDQYAIGFFRNLFQNKIETSVEIYFKEMKNQIDFKDNAYLILNPKLEGELRFGNAHAYGAEFLLRKKEGKLTGWISYTLSRSERKINGINNNRYYPSSFDKTHNLSIVGSYELSKRLIVSASWVYNTGSPVTIPAGRFEYNNSFIPIYTERNGYRMPDYHRLDLSVTLKGKEKPGKKFSGEWNFSLYNVYNRKNAFSLSFEQSKTDPGKTEAYKVYMFPIIPALSYNIKF